MPSKPNNQAANTFSAAVQQCVAAIPAGETRTYQQVAIAAGYPKAARAVANVLARNYDPAIPCHRVIRSDGSVGGYNRGGPAAKQAILLQESVADINRGRGVK